MKISRCGSQKFRGWVPLADVDAPVARWDGREFTAEITTRATTDRYYAGLRRPHWRAQLTVTEIRLLLDCLAEEVAKPSGAKLAEALAPSSQALLRLLYASSGLAHESTDEANPK